jgi:DNA-binding protein HU-beta
MMSNIVILEEIQKEIQDKALSQNILNSIISNITDSLKHGEPVKLTGFGTFKVIERKARKGINPRTGESLSIPARRVPKFYPGKNLKNHIQ